MIETLSLKDMGERLATLNAETPDQECLAVFQEAAHMLRMDYSCEVEEKQANANIISMFRLTDKKSSQDFAKKTIRLFQKTAGTLLENFEGKPKKGNSAFYLEKYADLLASGP